MWLNRTQSHSEEPCYPGSMSQASHKGDQNGHNWNTKKLFLLPHPWPCVPKSHRLHRSFSSASKKPQGHRSC